MTLSVSEFIITRFSLKKGFYELDFELRDDWDALQLSYDIRGANAKDRQEFATEHGVRWSAMNELPGWLTYSSAPLDLMHNLYLGMFTTEICAFYARSNQFNQELLVICGYKSRLQDISLLQKIGDSLSHLWLAYSGPAGSLTSQRMYAFNLSKLNGVDVWATDHYRLNQEGR
jgi:hypothetical protein